MWGKQGMIIMILLMNISCDGRLNLPLRVLYKLQILTLLGSRVHQNQGNTSTLRNAIIRKDLVVCQT